MTIASGTARIIYCSLGGTVALRLTVQIPAGQTPAPDLTTAASATLLVSPSPAGGPLAMTWTATLGTLTTTTAEVVHPWATGELVLVGYYSVTARIVLGSGAVYVSDSFELRVTA